MKRPNSEKIKIKSSTVSSVIIYLPNWNMSACLQRTNTQTRHLDILTISDCALIHPTKKRKKKRQNSIRTFKRLYFNTKYM